jgi:hypothetical protein
MVRNGSIMKGGKRPGAGRKPLPFKTRVLYMRIPEIFYDEIIALVKNYLKSKQNEPI